MMILIVMMIASVGMGAILWGQIGIAWRDPTRTVPDMHKAQTVDQTPG